MLGSSFILLIKLTMVVFFMSSIIPGRFDVNYLQMSGVNDLLTDVAMERGHNITREGLKAAPV